MQLQIVVDFLGTSRILPGRAAVKAMSLEVRLLSEAGTPRPACLLKQQPCHLSLLTRTLPPSLHLHCQVAACAYVHSSGPAFWRAGVADMPCLLLPRLLSRQRLLAAHRQLYSAGECWALGCRRQFLDAAGAGQKCLWSRSCGCTSWQGGANLGIH